MRVPFVDLGKQYETIEDEILDAIRAVFESTAFAGGPFVERFEQDFASFLGCEHVVALNSGTTALWAALLKLGIGPGDQVITVPSTFVATVEAICFAGAAPVLVDIEDRTYTLDVSQLEQAVGPRTKAIIPVHLFGHVADMDPILEIAGRHGLYVIEDACQAHGATYRGRLAGTMGDVGCFSFYPSKNLGAYGEGGAVATHNAELAAQIRMFRDHGQKKRYHHAALGWNGRMDGLQAAMLGVKLKYLETWNDQRRKNGALYTERLSGLPGVVLPREAGYAKHIYHVYAVRHRNRDALMRLLGEKGIGCAVHYPVPVHLDEAFQFLGYGKGSFPVAEKCAEELFSLPMFPELTEEQIRFVCDQVWASVAASSPGESDSGSR